jgi:hypothetical protein
MPCDRDVVNRREYRQIMTMRLRVPELLEEHEMTAYGLAKASNGRISLSTAYRLAAGEGGERPSMELLEALCEVFGIDDTGPLFAND